MVYIIYNGEEKQSTKNRLLIWKEAESFYLTLGTFR